MAEPGFPWLSRAHDVEKQQDPPVSSVRDFEAEGARKTSSEAAGKPFTIDGILEKHHFIRHASLHKKHHGSVELRPSAQPYAPRQSSVNTNSAAPAVRTIPPWIRSAEEDDLLPDVSNPHSALIAQHNYSPSLARKPLLGSREQRQDATPFFNSQSPPRNSRWVTFGKPSAYPRENFTGEKVSPQWINQQWGDYSQPWLANRDEGDDEDGNGRYHAFRRKREVWYKRSQYTILRNPFIPLVFRFIVFIFTLTALGLGASIYEISGREQTANYQGGPSAEMAIIVDAIAIVYLGYITYDEYFSKPLGLRSARAKVRLILLDIFFIVFQTSNLSLAFESMSNDSGACKNGADPNTDFTLPSICSRTEALAAVLLISLIAWLMTFSISVFR